MELTDLSHRSEADAAWSRSFPAVHTRARTTARRGLSAQVGERGCRMVKVLPRCTHARSNHCEARGGAYQLKWEKRPVQAADHRALACACMHARKRTLAPLGS